MYSTSPLPSMQSVAIHRRVPAAQELAIQWFGTNDKRALRVGIVSVLVIFVVGRAYVLG